MRQDDWTIRSGEDHAAFSKMEEILTKERRQLEKGDSWTRELWEWTNLAQKEEIIGQVAEWIIGPVKK
jgi:hypothetical protein